MIALYAARGGHRAFHGSADHRGMGIQVVSAQVMGKLIRLEAEETVCSARSTWGKSNEHVITEKC